MFPLALTIRLTLICLHVVARKLQPGERHFNDLPSLEVFAYCISWLWDSSIVANILEFREGLPFGLFTKASISIQVQSLVSELPIHSAGPELQGARLYTSQSYPPLSLLEELRRYEIISPWSLTKDPLSSVSTLV